MVINLKKFNKVVREMKVRVELHTHTKYSKDSLLNKWFYLFMLKIKKIKVVGITDHNEIDGAIEFKKFLDRHGIKVIVGEEISTEKGEIIGLFIKKRIKPGLSVRDTMEEIKRQKGLVYIPHPYDEKRSKTVLPEDEISKNVDIIDIIEVHNGRNSKSYYSEKQLAIANRYPSLYKVVGSDAHTFFELGRNYIIMENFNNKHEFIKNLSSIVLIKNDCIAISHQVTKIVRLLKLLKRGEFFELYKIINRRIKKSK